MTPQLQTLHMKTPGITELSNYYLVQLMIKERIRSIFTGESFDSEKRKEHALNLCVNYTTVPPTFTTPEECKNFWEQEALALVNNYDLYEQTPSIQTDLHTLKQMEGKNFQITSFTQFGIMIIIEVG